MVVILKMNNQNSQCEIRCPVHGFIAVSDWEKKIIDHPVFQRLRRIRQLAWTDEVYPGAMHTRFEHSLGVMHTATRLYDAIRANSIDVLKNELDYNDAGLDKDRQRVRFAALLHDVGHSPFSHASEDLFPEQNGKKFKHEQYSAEIIQTQLKDVIENYHSNKNLDIKAEDIAALLEGSAGAKRSLFWRELLDGQMDADRMDYLLRDSHHLGVQYGRFDLNRIINTIRAIPGKDGSAPRLGFAESGLHAVEGLVLARYFMFTQVYFHKTRVAYDLHLKEALAAILPKGKFPPPTGEQLEEFLKWDDWKVLGALANGEGGEHGKRLCARNHYRLVYKSPEVLGPQGGVFVNKLRKELGGLLAEEFEAAKSWYKAELADISIVNDLNPEDVRPLSSYSNIVKKMVPNNQIMFYAKRENVDEAKLKIKEVEGNERNSQGTLDFDSNSGRKT